MESSSLLDQVTDRLRADGGRMTSQRKLILEALQDCPDHPTAEELYERVRESDPTLNLSTVYRTLRWLEEAGFVNPRWFEDERRRERFDPVDQPGSVQEHYHFRCKRCNRIVEFSSPLLAKIVQDYEQEYQAQVESSALTLYGICQDCLA